MVPHKMWTKYVKVTNETNGFSVLHYATLKNHANVVSFLLKFHPNINLAVSEQ